MNFNKVIGVADSKRNVEDDRCTLQHLSDNQDDR